MSNKQLIIDSTLVRRLVAAQIPQWKDFAVRPVAIGGWDNKTFHLGEHMLVRMPSAKEYAKQIEKEYRWLPILAPLLPLSIPVPLVIGEPAHRYPWKWSIYRWLEGTTAASTHLADLSDFASNLAQFLLALQRIDPTNGPRPGLHNFYRGGALTHYNTETLKAIATLKDTIDVDTATEVWEAALATMWHGSPVWVHGDISVGNLLVQEGRLSSVIDFGMLAIGDPACDLAITWTLFKGKNREVFRTMLQLDAATWARGRAWTLWKALITLARFTDTNTIEAEQSLHIINEVLADHRQYGRQNT